MLFEVVSVVSEFYQKYKEESYQQEVMEKLDTIISHVDEIILREIRSANRMLIDAVCSGAYRTDPALLAKIEDCYFKNTGLDAAGSTGGNRNSRLIAISYFGLFQLGILRDANMELLSRYVLRTFEAGDPLARKEFSPEVYKRLFAASCLPIQQTYKARIASVATAGDYAKAAAIRAGQGAIVGGAMLIGSLFGQSAARSAGISSRGIAKELGNELPKAEYFVSKAMLEKEREAAIDKKCAELAKAILGEPQLLHA